ncbi:hypothetical protein [Paraburkholderia sp. MM5477-R1]|uniref:hypothetical protein n=1 Tax=Paraburkholderia sp. MM5477-R1 TaxID=2991062 RepID=UPI003D238354
MHLHTERDRYNCADPDASRQIIYMLNRAHPAERIVFAMLKKYSVSVFLMLACSIAHAEPQQLALFGTPLKGATREQLRAVFKAHGLVPLSEDSQRLGDSYDPSSVLQGATLLLVGYTANGKFAAASYKLPSFMDNDQVTRVIATVSQKYGTPSSRSGDASQGPVEAVWNFPGGMQIRVARDWPDTTTYLFYSDPVAYASMKAQISAGKHKAIQEKAAAQDGAF